ncbi:unnamed protein product [Arctia plantaginis]|uniref:Uncharacterized protein n=1 Tax=Arctia plantaginis TaxID=874455 RepID=A0A8S1A0R9_ARCPL|nr:unnamed protein product [Arctia plantaginis]
MGVPRHFPNSTEKSTRLSYNNAYIQKIPKKTDVTPRPSIAPTFKPTPHYSNRTNKRTDSYSDRDRSNIHKRFQELFNNTNLLNSDFPWRSSTNLTYVDPSLYEIPLPTKIKVVFENTPSWKYYLSAPGIIFWVLTMLKLFLCYQRIQNRYAEEHPRPSVLDTDPEQTNEIGPPPASTPTSPIIIDPECSTQNNSDSDLPPLYSQCDVNNIAADNKIVDNTAEDLPPSYFTCVDELNATNDIPKVHKREGREEQSRTVTDIHVN